MKHYYVEFSYGFTVEAENAADAEDEGRDRLAELIANEGSGDATKVEDISDEFGDE